MGLGPWTSITEAEHAEMEAEIGRLRAALEDVCNPMRVLQRHAEANDTKLNGMAYSIANNLAFVQEIARKALSARS